MKNKIIGICICLILITTVQSVTCEIIEEEKHNESNLQLLTTHEKLSISPGDYFRFIRVGWHIRTYRIHIPPSYDNEDPVPLVIVLHGYTSNSHLIKTKTNFDEKADEDGFIAVYPNGETDLLFLLEILIVYGHFGRYLNGGFCCGNAVTRNIDDVGFIETLIETLQDNLNINSSQIYVTGNSNGGIMSYRLGAEFSDTIAAIGVVGSSIGGRHDKDSPLWVIPEPEQPLPVIIIHGMKDDRVPYDGNIRFLSVNTSVSFWVEHNNCDPNPQINTSESGNIITRTYTNGSEGSEVILYSVVNGTHSWYGSKGSPIQEISATELIWEFFKQHPKQ